LANFLDQITVIRRFLRDPDALIWDSEQLAIYWNEAQIEIAQKIGYLQRARSLRYPSEYTIIYLYNWEYEYTQGDNSPVLQYAQDLQNFTGGAVIIYPWEAAYDHDSSQTTDDGYRSTQPWESAYGFTAEPPWVQLHNRLQTVRFVAFDEDTITGVSERQLAMQDGAYKTVQGEPCYYYFPDHYHNRMLLYPRPTITIIDADEGTEVYLTDQLGNIITTQTGDGIVVNTIPDYEELAYLYDWEFSEYSELNGYQFGHKYSTTYVYTYDWEYYQLNGDPVGVEEPRPYVYMRYWEYYGEGGIVSFYPATVDESDTGLSLDTIDTDNQLFIVYDYLPEDVEDYADDITDWPPYMFKCIIAGTLERAYGANTDGYIPSLRDFWKMRKEISIKAINIFRRLRSRDRDYRLGGSGRWEGQSSHPRLPSHYPAQEI
jgi:hypothetical protein